MADEEVASVNGTGLVRLSKRLADRNLSYAKLMRRIHKMIITVTKAEEEERLHREKIANPICGYDAKKWIEPDVQIRDKSRHRHHYHDVKLSPPIRPVARGRRRRTT